MYIVEAPKWIFEISPATGEAGEQIVKDWFTPEEDNIFSIEINGEDIEITVSEFIAKYGDWAMETCWTPDT